MVSKLGLRDHEKPKVGIWSPTLKNTGLLGFDERPDPFFLLARGHAALLIHFVNHSQAVVLCIVRVRATSRSRACADRDGANDSRLNLRQLC
jgi:hypothetical protein